MRKHAPFYFGSAIALTAAILSLKAGELYATPFAVFKGVTNISGIERNRVYQYLSRNNNICIIVTDCEEAVNFYQKVLGGESQLLRFGDAPPNPAFPVSDTFPNAPYSAGNNISFSLEFDTKDKTKAMFEALSDGGKVEMELQETFFNPLYSKFTDKFGVIWQLTYKAK